MRSNYKRLGDFIQLVVGRNKDLENLPLVGLSITKKFIPSIANTIGTDMSTYRTIERKQFAYGPVTSRNGDKITIALFDDYDKALISQAYIPFEVKNTNELDPEYLMMWFRRPEFDRYARFKSHGSAREIFDWNEMCDTLLPIPSPEKQLEIVKEYNTIQNRIQLNNQLIAKLEETAQAIYKQWFVDFEFPDKNGKAYKSNGGEMVFCEELEKEIPVGWSTDSLSSYAKYSNKRISIDDLISTKYISTENMLRNKKGILVSDEIPDITSALKFVSNNILISNIRPYLKKIWFADFEGGCSNDVLCIETLNKNYSYFIYNSLEQDYFFDYVMAGSKGTKMPRGDKQWIMDFKIVIPNIITLNKFSNFSKMAMNHRKVSEYENEKLEELKDLLLARMTKVESGNENVEN
ncbi:type I restriction enzyme, S subunit [Flavobacterium segetis]|uniref:Type I restriction enzyme, S subunit n=1 Tax=Flavobacterium segetis TaxID=271157 RepID=A0A1M5F9R4_9FLAO|nr:restriction endonuclease subunit S [Flavobacterium segetis]SHF88216.1 type I restriction enzyme, S subunit [Flavobacterium segetis]